VREVRRKQLAQVGVVVRERRRAVRAHQLQYGDHVLVVGAAVATVVVVVAVVVGIFGERHPPPRLEDGEHEHLRAWFAP